MKNFLIGLLALPVVIGGIGIVFWLGAMLLAVLGLVLAVLAVAIPFILKAICVLGIIGLVVYGLGKVVSGILP